MRAVLKFDLDSPEDEEKFRVCSEGVSWYMTVYDLDQWLRDRIKHHDESALQGARETLHRFMEENGVSLEDMS